MTEPHKRSRWLPTPGSVPYHLMLGAIAIFFLGPLGGVTAIFMVFKIGFFVGGQVLAGILGSSVTYGYGPEGKHGANYMQTMAASVASMAGMGTLVQAMVWTGMEQPPLWQLVAYFLATGMFGVGIGMLYTPILVDKLQLTFPSGLAVANILRALTDKTLLKQSIARLGTGTGIGIAGGIAAAKIAALEVLDISTSTFGAGMIVGARIGLSAITAGLTFHFLSPKFIEMGWLKPGEPFRKVAFLIALGMIMGAAIVDIGLLAVDAAKRIREKKGAKVEVSEKTKSSNRRLYAWVVVWGALTFLTATKVLGLSPLFIIVSMALVLAFTMINGISLGITDSNPISSAFVVTVMILAGIGLREPKVGLLAAGIVLVSTSIAGDMQQDRSTGARLGSDRNIQFRYQVVGVTMGAILAVVMAQLFMKAYPVLSLNPLSSQEAGDLVEKSGWQSAMTYKFAGALDSLTHPKAHTFLAIKIGLAIGFFTEVARKILKANAGYKKFSEGPVQGRVFDFLLDAVFLPSPYASSFGGFVGLPTSFWFGAGGTFSSLYDHFTAKKKRSEEAASETTEELPSDMSTTSLVGGGLIAGDSIAALILGVIGLLSVVGK